LRKNTHDAYQHDLRTIDINRKGLDNQSGRYTEIGPVYDVSDIRNPRAHTQTVFSDNSTTDDKTTALTSASTIAVRYKTHPSYKGLIWHAKVSEFACSANHAAIAEAQARPWMTNMARLWTGVAGVNDENVNGSRLNHHSGNYPRMESTPSGQNCRTLPNVQHPENPNLEKKQCPYILWPADGGDVYDAAFKYPQVRWDSNTTNPLFKHIKIPGSYVKNGIGPKECNGVGAQFLMAREFDAEGSCARIGAVSSVDAAHNGLRRVLGRTNVSINSDKDAEDAERIIGDVPARKVIFQDAATDMGTTATLPDLKVKGRYFNNPSNFSAATEFASTGHGWCEYPLKQTLTTPEHIIDFIKRSQAKNYLRDPLPGLDSDFSQRLLHEACSMEFESGKVPGHRCDGSAPTNNICPVYFSSGSETNQTAGYLCRQHLRYFPGVSLTSTDPVDSFGVPHKIKDAMIRRFCKTDFSTISTTQKDLSCSATEILERAEPVPGDYTNETLPASCRCVRAGLVDGFVDAAATKGGGLNCGSLFPRRSCFWGPCQVTGTASPDNDFSSLITSDLDTSQNDCPSVCSNVNRISGSNNVVVSAGQNVTCSTSTTSTGPTTTSSDPTKDVDGQEVLDDVGSRLRAALSANGTGSLWEEHKIVIIVAIVFLVILLFVALYGIWSMSASSKKKK
jgi:hypothetical protein